MLQAGGGIWVSELSRGKATTLRDDSAAVIAAVGALAASDRDAGVDVEVTEPLRRAVLSLRACSLCHTLPLDAGDGIECAPVVRGYFHRHSSQLSCTTIAALFRLTPVKALARCPCMVNSH